MLARKISALAVLVLFAIAIIALGLAGTSHRDGQQRRRA